MTNPFSKKARKPCGTCPFHKEARNTLLLGFASVIAVAMGVTWGVADRYATWRTHRLYAPGGVGVFHYIETAPVD